MCVKRLAYKYVVSIPKDHDVNCDLYEWWDRQNRDKAVSLAKCAPVMPSFCEAYQRWQEIGVSRLPFTVGSVNGVTEIHYEVFWLCPGYAHGR